MFVPPGDHETSCTSCVPESRIVFWLSRPGDTTDVTVGPTVAGDVGDGAAVAPVADDVAPVPAGPPVESQMPGPSTSASAITTTATTSTAPNGLRNRPARFSVLAT